MAAVATARAGLRSGRALLTSTPGRLRLVAVVLTVGSITFGLVALSAVNTRRDAARGVARTTEPLLVNAVALHGALSDADATASTTFVIGGVEPRARRQRYLSDLAAASSAVAVLAGRADASPETVAAVRRIGRDLPIYAGLIETARANNRQGLPVGAAYLRQASSLMRQRMLPAATRLYTVEARRLNRSYRSGTSSGAIWFLAVAAAGLLALLAGAQVYLARLTHRVFNLPLLAASALVLLMTAWALSALAAEQRALVRAQRDGSDSVEVLSAVRVLALRAQADEGLALAARGGGAAHLADFEVARRMLGAGPAAGLLDEASALAERTGAVAEVRRLDGWFVEYLRLHARVVALESEGRFRAAANLSVGRQSAVADEIRRELDRLLAASHGRFERAAADAHSALRGLALGIPLFAAGCAVLAFYGVRLRSNEYR